MIDAVHRRHAGPEGSEHFEALPERETEITSFLLQVRPVSNWEYLSFLMNGNADAYIPSYMVDAIRAGHELAPSLADRPVTELNWYDAVRYASSLGARLPTEDEWEYAGRGVDGRPLPWGDRYDVLKLPLRRAPLLGRHPERSSPFGVQDMIGVVSEWTGSRCEGGVIAKGCPFVMRTAHLSRRFCLQPEDRWFCTGFRCAKD